MRNLLVVALFGLIITAVSQSKERVKEVLIEKPVIKETVIERIIEKPVERIIEKHVIIEIEKPVEPRPANPYLEGWNDESRGIRRNHEMCQYYDDCVAYEQGHQTGGDDGDLDNSLGGSVFSRTVNW